MTTRQTPDAVREAVDPRVEVVAKALGLHRCPGGSGPINPPTRWPLDPNDKLDGRDGKVPLTWDFAEKCRADARVMLAALDSRAGDALRDALSEAIGALQPFADADEGEPEDEPHMAVWPTLKVGDLRRAVEAVKAGEAALSATPAVPADVFPARIGRVHLGERRSDGERLCSHGHPVTAGHPLYWPEQISQYDDSDPLCLTHAIDQLESDNADWGGDYEAVDAAPAGKEDDLDTPEARLEMVRVPLRRIVDDPTHSVAYAKAGLDLIEKTAAERAAMRGEA